jgi:hypothetical protein
MLIDEDLTSDVKTETIFSSEMLVTMYHTKLNLQELNKLNVKMSVLN